MTANHSPDHADAELVRYLDGELSDDERARVDALLAADADLARRLDVLRRRSGNLTTLLARTDPARDRVAAADPTKRGRPTDVAVASIEPARARRASQRTVPSKGWLRAAIILLVLVGAALIVPPVRAWVVGQLKRIVSSAPETPAAVMSPEPVVLQGEALDVAFEVAGNNFTIDVENVQAAGSLAVRSTDDTRGTASLAGGNGESFLVLPDGLRISNTPTSSASYAVRLPSNVTRITITVPGRDPVRIVRAAGEPIERSLDLGSR
jgi:hypothetical protein